MSGRRANPHKVKLHFSYSVSELAICLWVHKNTVRNWQAEGLEPIDRGRPVLFRGASVREFLLKRNARAKRPCTPGRLYCFRCRQPRRPALGIVDFIALRPGNGNLRAICEWCEAVMHRRIREVDIDRAMPGCTVQRTQGPTLLTGKGHPSLNCDSKDEG